MSEVFICSGLVQPLCLLGGLASMDVHSISALLAPHSTAPVEFALTLGDTGDSSCVIPSAAAHDFTAVCPFRCLAADTACSSEGTWVGEEREREGTKLPPTSAALHSLTHILMRKP